MRHISWTDITAFHNVRKLLQAYPHLTNGNSAVVYKAKVKLHGSCAGVAVEADGTVTAMSRSTVITPTSDNAGFARWVEERKESFAKFAPASGVAIIFGEWCGPGIQKGVAVNQLKERALAVFALRIQDTEGNDVEFIAEPTALTEIAKIVPGAYVLPWHNTGENYVVDWSLDAERLQPVLERINSQVLEVEACDPWMMSQFGVKGVGEGLVFYPVSKEHLSYKSFSDLCFKAKGEKHQVVAHTKPVQADPTVAANLAAFAELVVTTSRLEQGCRAVNGGELKFEPKNIGAFLAWMNGDLLKEVQDELDASGLDQKAALKACSDRARSWYLAEMKKL